MLFFSQNPHKKMPVYSSEFGTEERYKDLLRQGYTYLDVVTTGFVGAWGSSPIKSAVRLQSPAQTGAGGKYIIVSLETWEGSGSNIQLSKEYYDKLRSQVLSEGVAIPERASPFYKPYKTGPDVYQQAKAASLGVTSFSKATSLGITSLSTASLGITSLKSARVAPKGFISGITGGVSGAVFYTEEGYKEPRKRGVVEELPKGLRPFGAEITGVPITKEMMRYSGARPLVSGEVPKVREVGAGIIREKKPSPYSPFSPMYEKKAEELVPEPSAASIVGRTVTQLTLGELARGTKGFLELSYYPTELGIKTQEKLYPMATKKSMAYAKEKLGIDITKMRQDLAIRKEDITSFAALTTLGIGSQYALGKTLIKGLGAGIGISSTVKAAKASTKTEFFTEATKAAFFLSPTAVTLPYLAKSTLAKYVGTKVPSTEVFAPEVLRGEQQIPTVKTMNKLMSEFEKAGKGVHAAPKPLTSEVIGAGARKGVEGLHIAAYGRGSPYFLRVPLEKVTPEYTGFSFLPEIPRPTAAIIKYGKIARIPKEILIRGESIPYLKKQVGTGKVFVTPKAEAFLKKGRIAEAEAIIPAGTQLEKTTGLIRKPMKSKKEIVYHPITIKTGKYTFLAKPTKLEYGVLGRYSSKWFKLFGKEYRYGSKLVFDPKQILKQREDLKEVILHEVGHKIDIENLIKMRGTLPLKERKKLYEYQEWEYAHYPSEERQRELIADIYKHYLIKAPMPKLPVLKQKLKIGLGKAGFGTELPVFEWTKKPEVKEIKQPFFTRLKKSIARTTDTEFYTEIGDKTVFFTEYKMKVGKYGIVERGVSTGKVIAQQERFGKYIESLRRPKVHISTILPYGYYYKMPKRIPISYTQYQSYKKYKPISYEYKPSSYLPRRKPERITRVPQRPSPNYLRNITRPSYTNLTYKPISYKPVSPTYKGGYGRIPTTPPISKVPQPKIKIGVKAKEPEYVQDLKRVTKYKPSIVGVEQKYRIKKIPKILTGVEIRGIK